MKLLLTEQDNRKVSRVSAICTTQVGLHIIPAGGHWRGHSDLIRQACRKLGGKLKQQPCGCFAVKNHNIQIMYLWYKHQGQQEQGKSMGQNSLSPWKIHIFTWIVSKREGEEEKCASLFFRFLEVQFWFFFSLKTYTQTLTMLNKKTELLEETSYTQVCFHFWSWLLRNWSTYNTPSSIRHEHSDYKFVTKLHVHVAIPTHSRELQNTTEVHLVWMN